MPFTSISYIAFHTSVAVCHFKLRKKKKKKKKKKIRYKGIRDHLSDKMSLSLFLSSMIKFESEFRLKHDKIHFLTTEMTSADVFYPDFIHYITYCCRYISF